MPRISSLHYRQSAPDKSNNPASVSERNRLLSFCSEVPVSNVFDIPEGYETKTRILRAIGGLLEDGGDFESLSVSRICEAARLSSKTLYRHFDDRKVQAHRHDSMHIAAEPSSFGNRTPPVFHCDSMPSAPVWMVNHLFQLSSMVCSSGSFHNGWVWVPTIQFSLGVARG